MLQVGFLMVQAKQEQILWNILDHMYTAVHMSSIIKVNAQEKFLCRKLICGPYIMLYVVDKL